MRGGAAWSVLALLLLTTAAAGADASHGAVYDRGFAFGLNGHATSIIGRADFASDGDYQAYLQGIKDGYARFRMVHPASGQDAGQPENCGT